MTWVPKPEALARWRNFRRMKVEELAKLANVSVRSIGRLESENERPKTCRDELVEDLAKGLSDKKITCKPDYLFYWRRHDGTFDAEPDDDPTLPKKPARKTAAKPSSDKSEAEPAAKKRTITQNAALERKLGLHDQTVSVGKTALRLVGAHRLQRIEAEYVDLQGSRFAIIGSVDDCRPIPPVALDELKAERGRGGRQFKVTRVVEGVHDDGEPVSFEVYATVFASDPALSAELLRCHEEGIAVTIETKLVVALAHDDWRGFFHYEGPRSRPSPKEWALVATGVQADEQLIRASG